MDLLSEFEADVKALAQAAIQYQLRKSPTLQTQIIDDAYYLLADLDTIQDFVPNQTPNGESIITWTNRQRQIIASIQKQVSTPVQNQASTLVQNQASTPVQNQASTSNPKRDFSPSRAFNLLDRSVEANNDNFLAEQEQIQVDLATDRSQLIDQVSQNVATIKEIAHDMDFELTSQITLVDGLNDQAESISGRLDRAKQRIPNLIDQSSTTCNFTTIGILSIIAAALTAGIFVPSH